MATTQDYIRDLTGLGYSFKYNEVTGDIEVNGKAIDDMLEAKIRTQMRDLRHKRMTEIADAWMTHAGNNCYHPVRDYFSRLQWDGGDHIGKLTDYFTDKHGVFPLYLRRWLIGAVAKAHTNSRNFMLVLDGVQYIGKSRFCRWLCPLPDYFMEGPLNTDDKDTWWRLTSTFVWELSELDATTKRADRSALKDFISRQEVTMRRPYARHDTTRPALASLIGTINEEGPGFLNDPTGNTRFAVVNLLSIDFGYENLDVDQVWAEAFVAWQSGESWELTITERRRQEEINSEYENEATLDGMIRRYYDLDPTADVWTSGIEIILELETYGLREIQRASLMQLAMLMKKWGHERKRVKQVWSYRGVTRRAPGAVI